jgi:hypothetical protein
MDKRRTLPLFAAPPAEVAEARERLTREECPRRYCWYWHSLSFDWEWKPEDGCGVAHEHFGDARLKRQRAEVRPWRRCCRASGNPQDMDYYEPREPHLQADDWAADYFQMVGKEVRRRRFERRRRGQHRRKRERGS